MKEMVDLQWYLEVWRIMKGSKWDGLLNSLFHTFSDKCRLGQSLSSMHHPMTHSRNILTTTLP